MEKKLEHTPTPYHLETLPSLMAANVPPIAAIMAADNQRVAIVGRGAVKQGTPEGNAAFILRACNNHDALVGVIKQLMEAIDDEGEHEHDPDDCDVCYALDKAEWRLERLEKQGEAGANDLLLEAVGLIGTMLENTVDGLELMREIMTPAQCTVLESYTVDFKEWLDKAKGGA